MRLRFTKMHGLGNDFVVIDGINQAFKPTPERIRKLSDRNFGIGCDQVLLVETPQSPDVDFSYRIFNHEGSEVENCGNGARCFAKFVRDRKLTGLNRIRVQTSCDVLILDVKASGEVTVDMGRPVLAPEAIPTTYTEQQLLYPLPTSMGEKRIAAVSMGNPHGVLQVDDVASAPVLRLGAEIEQHTNFPNRVNVGFMAIRSRTEMDLRVFERGVGETLACGTGACAAVVAAQLQGLVDDSVKVNLPGGSLQIEWQGEGSHVFKTGPASSVYHGQITI